jgi:hypothetical protein
VHDSGAIARREIAELHPDVIANDKREAVSRKGVKRRTNRFL